MAKKKRERRRLEGEEGDREERMLRNDESMVYGSIEIDTPGIMLALLDFGWVLTQGLAGSRENITTWCR